MSVFSKEKSCWITWEVQTRNRSMARLLDVRLFELVIKKPRYIKYPLLILRTFTLVLRNRISVLFVQNPSIVLSFLAVIIRFFSRMKLVVDAHNAGVYPLEGRSHLLNIINRFIIRNSDITIVTNANLAEAVARMGGRPFVMPDPLPELHGDSKLSEPHGPTKAFFICTWADDEPYHEVIEAARMLGDKVEVRITGNYKKRLSEKEITDIPANVKLLGFVTEEDFIRYFSESDVSLDLTTRDNCLVCGAYESMALGVPGIISESSVNREIFYKGFVYSKNDAASIAKAITEAVHNLTQLRMDIADIKTAHEQKMRTKAVELINRVNSL